MRYAQNTSVSVESSKAEIEKTLSRYGAEQFISGWDQMRAYIGFKMLGRSVKMVIKLPDKSAREFTHTPAGRVRRNKEDQFKAWEQACRQRWRSLALRIKAKLEAIESGDADFDDEFMANILLPDGSTISDFMRPQIEVAYQHKKMPNLIPWTKEHASK